MRWVALGELGTFTRGRRFVRSDIVDSGIPCIHYGELYTHYGTKAQAVKSHIRSDINVKLRYASKNDVVIVAAGETVEDLGVGVAWIGEENVAVHDACFIFKHNLNPRYVSHFLRTQQYHAQITPFVSTGKISSLPVIGLKQAKIPIVSETEQNRIADILDSFDAYCNSISEGIPAEIESRKKQYEYYRDKLLSFQEV